MDIGERVPPYAEEENLREQGYILTQEEYEAELAAERQRCPECGRQCKEVFFVGHSTVDGRQVHGCEHCHVDDPEF